MHMSACAKRQFGKRAHKATLYKIEDKVAKINRAIHDVPGGLYFAYCLGSRLNSPKALSTSLEGLAILANFSTKTCPFSKIEFWYALNSVKPPLSCLKNQKFPRAFGLVSIVFGY